MDKKIKQYKNTPLEKFKSISEPKNADTINVNLSKLTPSPVFISQGGIGNEVAAAARFTRIEQNVNSLNNNIIKMNKNLHNVHKNTVYIKSVTSQSARNIERIYDAMDKNFEMLFRRINDGPGPFSAVGGGGGFGGGGISSTVAGIAMYEALKKLLPAVMTQVITKSPQVLATALFGYAGYQFIKETNKSLNDTGLSSRAGNKPMTDKQQIKKQVDDYLKGSSGRYGGPGISDAKGIGVSGSKDPLLSENARERARAQALSNLPTQQTLTKEIAKETVSTLIPNKKELDNFKGTVAAAAGSTLFKNEFERNDFKEDVKKGVLNQVAAMFGLSTPAAASAMHKQGVSSGGGYKGGYDPSRSSFFPPSLGSTSSPIDLGGGSRTRGLPNSGGSGGGTDNRPSSVNQPLESGKFSGFLQQPSPSLGNLPSATEKVLGNVPGAFKGGVNNIGSTDLTPNNSGKIDSTNLRNYLMKKAQDEGLVGTVPPDGAKYGIHKGTKEEWANFLVGLAYHESGFRPNAHGDVGRFGGHGSRGIFQLSPQDAPNYKLNNGQPFSISQLEDPKTNTDAAVAIARRLITKHGGIEAGMGKYWGPIRRGVIPNQTNKLPWEQWRQNDAKISEIDTKGWKVGDGKVDASLLDPSMTGTEKMKGVGVIPGGIGDGLNSVNSNTFTKNDKSPFTIEDRTAELGFGNKFGDFQDGVKGLTVHHTAGRGGIGGVINTFKQRNFPTQYIMDRDGNIARVLPEGAKGQHMRQGQGKGEGYGNHNMEGIEVIANNNQDWTEAQKKKMIEFGIWHAKKYGYDPMQTMFGHGEVNSHKEADEGMVFLEDFRKNYEKYKAEYEKKYPKGMTPGVTLPTPTKDDSKLESHGFKNVKSKADIPSGYEAFLGAAIPSSIKSGTMVNAPDYSNADWYGTGTPNVKPDNMDATMAYSTPDSSGWNPSGSMINQMSIEDKIKEAESNAKSTHDVVQNLFNVNGYGGGKEDKDDVMSNKVKEASAGPSLSKMFEQYFGKEDEDKNDHSSWH